MPSYFILLHCTPITMHLPPLLLLLLPRCTPSLCSPYNPARSSPRPFSDLSFPCPAPASARSHIYYHHQHSPIRYPTVTYIVPRNAESYSVSLDSLKQVSMSCTPTPRSSPTIYSLATEHSSRTLVLLSTPQSISRDSLQVSSSSLCLSLSLSFFSDAVFLCISLSVPFPRFIALSFPFPFAFRFSFPLQPPSLSVLLQRSEFAITADTLLMPNWS